MSASSPESAERHEQPITIHYVLVVVSECAVIAALAWLAAAFR